MPFIQTSLMSMLAVRPIKTKHLKKKVVAYDKVLEL